MNRYAEPFLHKYGAEVCHGVSRYATTHGYQYGPYNRNDEYNHAPISYESGVDIRMRESQFEHLCRDINRFQELWNFLRDCPEAEAQFAKWRVWQELKK